MFGLRGWQIMYIAEAIPTVLIGVVTLVRADRPAGTGDIPDGRGKNLARRQACAERKAKEAVKTFGMWQAMFDPKVLLLSLNYFGIVVASLGMLIFIPQIIKSIGSHQQHDGRLAHHDPLHLRRHLPCCLGPHFRPHA